METEGGTDGRTKPKQEEAGRSEPATRSRLLLLRYLTASEEARVFAQQVSEVRLTRLEAPV